ncbi:MAG: ImmA/IrrE family metallo-endopeptidase [Pseudomonadota bacterium]
MSHSPRRAVEILETLRLKRPEDIDLEAIAWLQGAKVDYREMDGCEACIHGRADVGRAIVAVNNAHRNLRRQRFSLAHELGHWEWHRGEHLFCTKEEIGGSRGLVRGLSWEKGANQFASELLMPEFMLKKAMSDVKKFDMRNVQLLADAFSVSKTAMAYRLVDLDFEPSILASYSRDGLNWFKRSKSVGERWFLRRTLDQQSNPYDILHKCARDDISLSLMDADTWFETEGADRYELCEQSFRVGDDEIIALLVLKSEYMMAR